MSDRAALLALSAALRHFADCVAKPADAHEDPTAFCLLLSTDTHYETLLGKLAEAERHLAASSN